MRPHTRGMCGMCEGGSIHSGMAELTRGSSAISCIVDTKIDRRASIEYTDVVEALVDDNQTFQLR